MIVSELINLLKKCPQDMAVKIIMEKVHLPTGSVIITPRDITRIDGYHLLQELEGNLK